MSSPEHFQIFTSLRHDPALLTVPDRKDITSNLPFYNASHRSPFYNLDLHRDRLLRAAAHFKWPSVVSKLTGEAGLEFLTATIPEDIQAQLQQDHDTGISRKLRISIDKDGVVTHHIAETPPRPLEGLFATRLPSSSSSSVGAENTSNHHEKQEKREQGNNTTAPLDPLPQRPAVLIDTHPVRPSAFTHFKTTSRAPYDAARARMPADQAAPAPAPEILLVNGIDGGVLEGSFTTPYFWRDGRWVTPPVTNLAPKHGGGWDEGERGWTGGHDGVSRRWAIERGLAVEQVVPAGSVVDGEECWLSNGVRGFYVGKVKLLS